MTLERCNDCRRTGLYHCSDPFNCDGMKMPTWSETEQDLQKIQQAFVSLHNTGEKNWSLAEKELAHNLRKRCVKLAEHRYSLLRKKNEPTN
jgi:hypothetical protein